MLKKTLLLTNKRRIGSEASLGGSHGPDWPDGWIQIFSSSSTIPLAFPHESMIDMSLNFDTTQIELPHLGISENRYSRGCVSTYQRGSVYESSRSIILGDHHLTNPLLLFFVSFSGTSQNQIEPGKILKWACHAKSSTAVELVMFESEFCFDHMRYHNNPGLQYEESTSRTGPVAQMFPARPLSSKESGDSHTVVGGNQRMIGLECIVKMRTAELAPPLLTLP